MHIPNERVYNEMRSEIASLWYLPAIGDSNLAFLIKAPTTSIKALILGCPISLIFGKQDNYLCTGVKIFDVPDTPVFISGIQKELEEHNALINCLKARKFPIFLFNEMNVCVASSELELTENDSISILNFIGDTSHLFSGEFDKTASHILDCFCYTTDKAQKYNNANTIPTIEIHATSTNWKTTKNYFYGNSEYKCITINDINEGENFENTVWSLMASVFPETIYKSPFVKIGQKKRELTDVFANYKFGSFLIEAKDASVILAGYNRNQDRRLASIQKQVEKAIKQLSGAASAYIRNDEIYDNKNNLLLIDRSQPPHCIILITEFIENGKWDEIYRQMLKAFVTTGAFFNILDLRELTLLIQHSSFKPELFDYNLMQRCKFCLENKEVFVRAK